MLRPKKEQKEKVKITKSSIKKAKGIFTYLKPYAGIYFIGWIFLVLSTSAGLVFPYLMGKLLGAGAATSNVSEAIGLIDMSNINNVAIALFVLFGFQSLFSFIRVVLFNNVTENALRDLRNDAFSKLVYMPMDFFNRNKVGELTSRLSSDITQIQETLRTTIAEFFRQIIIVVGGILFLFFISWKLALIMLGTVPVMAIIAVIFGRYIRRLSKEAQDYVAESNSIVEEALTGIANVKAFTNELFIFSNYKKSTQQTRDLNVRSGIWRGLFVSFIIFCLFGAIVFIVWRGLLMTQGAHPELNREGFYQFVLFTIMMGASVGSLPDLYASVQKAIGSTENLMDIIHQETEIQTNKGSRKDKLTGGIQFKQVRFSYPQRSDVEVLKEVSFEVKENQTLALVGQSGSGKSTISNLLLQFYTLNHGEISFDGIPANEMDLNALRDQMAIVPQEVILFSGSIRENILFGNPAATEEQIMEAAKQANAWEFIDAFPKKLETEVGDRGIQLSGGQKQRIAIARAILKNPTILILDEATSALDSESERLVQDALDKLMKGRTSIVIAHRLSTIRNADQILVLQSGKVEESGTHQSLMELKGLYADYVGLQSMNQ
ncbi:MAG: ABC transporter ATP-binding protein/permease [Crocinitomicaceae bacterium]|nr:ABC transporter ATP-binding protein/permease [Crocinitomicaceae bacterium]MDP4760922.1 ABC transporter ATP-binding protein/permease [Crocinitomicaceae bacterium]